MNTFEDEFDFDAQVGTIQDWKDDEGKIVKSTKVTQISEDSLVQWIETHPHSHEVLLGNCKLYLDYDLECKDKEEFDEQSKDRLIELWTEVYEFFDDERYPDFSMTATRADGFSKSKGKWKISAHIVVSGIGYRCCGVDWLPTVNKLRKNLHDLDIECYKNPGKRQSLRFIGASKMDDPDRKLTPFKVSCVNNEQFIVPLDINKINIREYLASSVDGEEQLTPLCEYDAVTLSRYIPDEEGEQKFSTGQIQQRVDHIAQLIQALAKDRASTEPAAFRGIGAIRRIAMKYRAREAFRPLAHAFAKLTTRNNYNQGWVNGQYDRVRECGPGYSTLKQWADKDTPGWNRVAAAEVAETFYNDVQALVTNKDTTVADVQKHMLGCLAKVSNDGNSVWFARGEKGWTLMTSGKEGFPFTSRSETYTVAELVPNPKYNAKKAGSNEFITITRSYSTILEQLSTEPAFLQHCTFSHTDFLPYLGKESPHPKKVFNLFAGFKWAPRADWTEPTKCKLLITHIEKVLAAGNQEHADYIIDLLAQMFQQPDKKIGICMVFRSKQRAGKNTVFDFIRRKMLPEYSDELTDMDQLTQKHNSHRMRSLFTVLNEVANYGGSYKSNDKLKSIITDPQIKIEPKGREAFSISDFCRYVMLTNNDWPVKNDKDEGRYACFQCSNEMIGNTDYFTALHESLDDECAEDFFQCLVRRDISARNFRKLPKTEFSSELALNSESTAVKFMMDIANGELLFEEDDEVVRISGADLYTTYASHCKTGNEFVLNRRAFAAELTKMDLQTRSMRIDDSVKRGFEFEKAELQDTLRTYLKRPDMKFA